MDHGRLTIDDGRLVLSPSSFTIALRRGKSMIKNAVIFFVAIGLWIAGCSSRAATKQTANASIPAAEAVLKQVSESVCPLPKDPGQADPFMRSYHSAAAEASFSCAPAAGHSVDATLRLFASADGARGEFEAERKEHGAVDFHGYPMVDYEEDSSDLPGGRNEYRIRFWQAGVWLIEVRAFDDTAYLMAPDPADVSEAIYQAGVKAGMFAKGD
jgi:hypothetical protein